MAAKSAPLPSSYMQSSVVVYGYRRSVALLGSITLLQLPTCDVGVMWERQC